MEFGRNRFAASAMALAAGTLLAACGGGSSGAAGTSAAAGAELTGVGPITYVQGKDNNGRVQPILDKWNAAHADQKVTLIELPSDADSQRQQMIANAQTKSDQFGVLSVDNVWVSEFAANRYITALPEASFPLDKMLPPVLSTGKYRGTLYAVPESSDGGMLYYRTDLLKAAGIAAPPKTWAEMFADCTKVQATPEGKGVFCYAGQFQKYEGLTVNAAEAINGAGGVITDDNGKPNVNTPEAKKGLDFLVQAYKNGQIPKEAITYKEEEGRNAFQAGKLLFHRQWPYQYSLVSATDGSSKVNGKFAVAPLPGLDGPGVSSLGGHNLGISAYAKNKKTAADFIAFFTSEETNKFNLEKASLAPVYTSLYDDPALQKQFPYLATLKASIESAKPRPKVVRYGDATIAIQDAAYSAITGAKTTDAALSELQTKLQSLTGSS
jgi:multiple sugar transport system substrate-binding protein